MTVGTIAPYSYQDGHRGFNDIYQRYWSDIYLFSYNILRDKDLAKDVVQDVFVGLLNSDEPIENVKAYLIQAAKFRIYNIARAEKVKLKVFDELAISEVDNATLELLQVRELQQQVERSVLTLPQKCRTIFSLRQDGLSAKKIAELTGLSHRTVEHQLYIALKKLRSSLGQLLLSWVIVVLSGIIKNI